MDELKLAYLTRCNRDCNKCKHLNIRTDDKGYPYGYDCLKHNDSVFQPKFRNTKKFKTETDSDGLS